MEYDLVQSVKKSFVNIVNNFIYLYEVGILEKFE